MSDVRSPLAIKIINANPNAYQALVVQHDTPPQAHELLDGVQPEQLTASGKSSVAAYAMLAGLWLWHDGLEECHRIAQKSPEGLAGDARNLSGDWTGTLAFWHAIMHRREGDFSNSKYWYARAGRHPVLDSIGAYAALSLNPLPADKSLLRLLKNGWDVNAFVDLVQELHAKPDETRLPAARALQQIEWRLLFEHCARDAGQ